MNARATRPCRPIEAADRPVPEGRPGLSEPARQAREGGHNRYRLPAPSRLSWSCRLCLDSPATTSAAPITTGMHQS